MKDFVTALRPNTGRAAGISLLVTLTALVVIAAPAGAAWQHSGLALCGPCEGNPGQFLDPSAASDGTGGVYASWWDNWLTLRVRHLTVTGDDVPGWSSFGLAPTNIVGFNHYARLAPDGAGGVYVGWLESTCTAHCNVGDGARVYAQHLTYAGTQAIGWPAAGLPATTLPGYVVLPPSVAADGLGGFLIAWMQPYRSPSGNLNAVRVQRFTATGVLPWSGAADGVLVAPASTGAQLDPVVTGDGAGGALVAWTDTRPATSVPQIYLQHVDANGALRDSAGVALTASAYNQRLPQMMADGAGGAFLVWQDSTAGTGVDLRAQRLDALGNALWGSGVAVTQGSPGDECEQVLSPDGAGGVYIAWTDRGAGGRILATRLDGAGQLVPPWRLAGSLVNTGTGGLSVPRIAPDGAQGFYASWVGGYREFATRIKPDTTCAPGWPLAGIPLCSNGPDSCQYVETFAPIHLVANGTGGAVAVWQEWRIYPEHGYVDYERSYAQGLGVSGPVPTLVSLVSADASDGCVRVEWQVSDDGGWDVERKVGERGAWELLARALPDGQDRVTVEDHDVQPGGRYGYRLGRGDGAHRETFGETWLDVPRAGELRISGARPNPTPGELHVAFALRDASPASLEVFDAAGRLVAVRRLEGLGAGAHDLRLDESAGLPSGVYLVRLSQGGRSVATRACLLH